MNINLNFQIVQAPMLGPGRVCVTLVALIPDSDPRLFGDSWGCDSMTYIYIEYLEYIWLVVDLPL